MIRTILSSPGVELNEVDKSQYTPTTIDTFRVLLPGFSSKGDYNTPTTITSLLEFSEKFGNPSNEAEKYAFNAADIIMGDGGEVIFSRLPYSGKVYYPYNEYTIGDLSSVISPTAYADTIFDYLTSNVTNSSNISEISSKDIKMIQIKNANSLELDTLEETFDKKFVEENLSWISGATKFAIFDITKTQYFPHTTNGGQKIDCLGIIPVVTTVPNILAVQGDLKDPSDKKLDMWKVTKNTQTDINLFESLSDIQYLINATESREIKEMWNSPPKSTANDPSDEDKKDYFTNESISKMASRATFNNERILMNSDGFYENTYFGHIGVAVFRIISDKHSGYLDVELVETFTGSLDNSSNSSIEERINNSSKYIRFYASDGVYNALKKSESDEVSLPPYVLPQSVLALGTPPDLLEKKIKTDTITNSLDIIFDKMGSPLSTILDVVCDGGLSTIYQFVTEEFNVKTNEETDPDGYVFKLDNDNFKTISSDNTAAWKSLVNKFKTFCENNRKDCVFVTESPRHFSLQNNMKKVDLGDGENTPKAIIEEGIKKISGINSSYGWGYAPWFKIADVYSGKVMWMPSSPFGVAAYLRSRRRFNVWDAPAGMTRGAINVADISFEPDLQTRNTLYSHNWNYAMTYTNGGTVLEGQKTFQVRPSAFDRINVRSLFLYLERRVFQAAQYFIYEPNTGYTRQQFVDTITPMFESTKAAGGVYDYKIICDESLNTPDVIDNNEFRVRIGIKPTKTIEFIMIEFVALRTGSTFEELV